MKAWTGLFWLRKGFTRGVLNSAVEFLEFHNKM